MQNDVCSEVVYKVNCMWLMLWTLPLLFFYSPDI